MGSKVSLIIQQCIDAQWMNLQHNYVHDLCLSWQYLNVHELHINYNNAMQIFGRTFTSRNILYTRLLNMCYSTRLVCAAEHYLKMAIG